MLLLEPMREYVVVWLISKIFAAFCNEAHEPTIKKEKANSAINRMENQLEIICKKEKSHDSQDTKNSLRY